jgi:hypothetical protein
VFLFLEAQSYNEVKGMTEGSQELTLLCNMTSDSDIIAATDRLYKDGWMNDPQRKSLSSLKPGECFFVELNKKVKKRYFFMPRSMFWEPGMNFYSMWERMRNSWINTSDILDAIEEDYKKEKKAIFDKKKVEELIKEKKAEEKKAKEEETEEKEAIKKIERETILKKKEIEIKERILGNMRRRDKPALKKRQVVISKSDDPKPTEEILTEESKEMRIPEDAQVKVVKVRSEDKSEDELIIKPMADNQFAELF